MGVIAQWAGGRGFVIKERRESPTPREDESWKAQGGTAASVPKCPLPCSTGIDFSGGSGPLGIKTTFSCFLCSQVCHVTSRLPQYILSLSLCSAILLGTPPSLQQDEDHILGSCEEPGRLRSWGHRATRRARDCLLLDFCMWEKGAFPGFSCY
jgi:hypothetical protein